MRRRDLRIGLSIGFVFLILAAGAALKLRHSQITRHGGVLQASDPALKYAAATDADAFIPAKHIAMAEVFRSGQLPQPLPLPAGDADRAAEELAKKIAMRDEGSTAALVAALQMAGFGINARDGSLTVKPAAANQGLAFSADSVASMAKLFNDGWQMSLADLSAVLAKAIPRFEKLPLSEILTEGIVNASQGDQPLRFWAWLIIDLGKQSPSAYDLSAGKLDPAAVQLDSIQVSLILERLFGDMESRAKAARPPAHALLFRNELNELAILQPAVFRPAGDLRFLRARMTEPPHDSPCSGEIAENILDTNALINTTNWRKLIGLESDEAPGVSEANALLAILRFTYIYANMNVKVTMDNAPLVRTHDTDPGESRILTAKVWFDMKNEAMLNCLRPFMNIGTVDIGNLPNGGAAEGVGVAWRLTEGGAPLPGEYHNDPAGLLEATKNALVYFDNGGGAEGSTWNKETNDQGETKIKVTGNPQRKDLSSKRRALMREMAVAVDVKFKNGSKANKVVGEFLDVLGPGFGLGSHDLIGGLTGAVTETMFRMHWNIDGAFAFPVKDWVEIGSWTGTIRVVDNYEPNFPPNVHHDANRDWTATTVMHKTSTTTYTLEGVVADDYGTQVATISMSYDESNQNDSIDKVQDDCHSSSNIVTYTTEMHGHSSKKLTKNSYKGVVTLIPFTDPNGNMTYNVQTGLALGEDPTNNGTFEGSNTGSRSGCGEFHDLSSPVKPQILTIGVPAPTFRQAVDPAHSDTLSGKEEHSSPDGYYHSITWDLHKH